MNRLIHELAKTIREQVMEATRGRSGAKLESRFVFNGPPLEFLEGILAELAQHGGILLPIEDHVGKVILPVLLPLAEEQYAGGNPDIGESGKCHEPHLHDVRDHPQKPSFLALLPPGLHINSSLDTTTSKLGIASGANAQSIPFDQWWNDGFVQHLARQGLRHTGLGEQDADDAMLLLAHTASALDDMDHDKGSRRAVWRLLSRIYSLPDNAHGLDPRSAVALACGVPPMQDNSFDSKFQVGILAKIADALSDGFRTSIERLVSEDCSLDVVEALGAFLKHIQANCDVPTAILNAPAAFYLPEDSEVLQPPPVWWTVLTTEQWANLLAGEPDDEVDDLSISCTNAILPVVRGQPALVWKEVELKISVGSSSTEEPTEVWCTGGGQGKVRFPIMVHGSAEHSDDPSVSVQKNPITYKAESAGHKAAIVKVVSLATWTPGVFVTCRVATKVAPPKKARNARSGANWESTMSLPGSGRYELLVLASSGTKILAATGVPDDATEGNDGANQDLDPKEVRSGEYMVEIEADGKFLFELTFQREGSDKAEKCRTYLACEEVREEGCRSEFERLIKRNRQHLDKASAKAVVQLDRNARLSSLQAWMLEERSIEKSFLPVVIADDYAATWAPPDWNSGHGPILSEARFLHDPRPDRMAFVPSPGFCEARRKIAERIRASTDEQNGLMESAPLGAWMARDEEFRVLVEQYLDAYSTWLVSDQDVACWVDTMLVCAREGGGHTLARVPDAIILSPLHPLRLAWHCLAQQVLHDQLEGSSPLPCPAASILDPDCVPDIMTISLQSPGGILGIERATFISVECNSDYWSVLWHGARLGQITDRTRHAPFDSTFGLIVGGISTGFSPAQVARAMGDVMDLLAAKPIVSVVVSSAGGSTDACNEGLTGWCAARFGNGSHAGDYSGAGPRLLEVYDTRNEYLRPDEATIANLSEDTNNHVRWYRKQPDGAIPDLGIIAQLDSVQPELVDVGILSPLGWGGLVRHRVRRQLAGSFLSESRQALFRERSGDGLADKVVACILALESGQDGKHGLQFSPNIHAVSSMLEDNKAGFVAVSSSAIDPACFLGGWVGGAYLWDYDLPSYSSRAGDTSGYYLLSQVRDSDKEALAKVLEPLPIGKQLDPQQVEAILLEVARRGIPTVRGLSGDDTGATGDLGLFLAVRLLQDQFRVSGNVDSLIPVLSGREGDATIALIVPVDPFRGYLADLARSLGMERKDATLSRPDLLVIGIHASDSHTRLLLTPIEVKCRMGSTLSMNDSKDALSQAKAMSSLLHALDDRASKSALWRLAFQHLLLSMIGFGLRVYSQQAQATANPARWAVYHERIAATILGTAPGSIEIEDRGRLIIVDSSPTSDCRDTDSDGMAETIAISNTDAARIVAGDADSFYVAVRKKVGNWQLLPDAHGKSGKESGEGGTTGPLAPVAPDFPNHPLRASLSLAEPTDEVSTEVHPTSCTKNEDQNSSQGNAKGIMLSVGCTVDGFEPRPLTLNISDTCLNQLNIGVVGDLGTGKTQLLKSLIFQIATAREENRGIKPRFLIFDYKRDYSNSEFVSATGARVVRPYRLPFNLFDTSTIGESTAPWLDRFRFFSDVLDKVYTGIGPVQRDKLKTAVRNAYESSSSQGRQPTIYDIHTEYRELLAGKSDSPMAIIDDLVDMEIFEPDPAKTRPFEEFLDGIVVISLDAMGQDDRSKNMLVAVMLNMFYENMLRTPKHPFIGTDPQLRVIDSYLLVDEADNIMRCEFDVLRKLLLQGREFGVGVILASQYLRHFKAGATDYREPLLTWFIHKVPNVTPAELGALGLTSELGELSEKIKTLPNHHCLYKSYDISGEVIRGLPFYEITSPKHAV